MSHTTLTEDDSLDTDNSTHDRSLNGPPTFCKIPSEAPRRLRSSKSKQADIEEVAATTIREPSVRIAHDPAFETNYKDESFCLMMDERAGWLVGLLLFQSVSSFILEDHQALLQRYQRIVKFLTMLVGAGGNAGGQACVRAKHHVTHCTITMNSGNLWLTFSCLCLHLAVIRCLSVGTLKHDSVKLFLAKELIMGVCLTFILGLAGFVRVIAFDTSLLDAFTIMASLLVVTMTSIMIGATLPLIMNYYGIDPAHSSTTIQVIMDILGVTVTVYVSGAILESSIGK